MTIKLDIEVGDIVLTGKFKNKRTVVKKIGTDELGQPTINGKPILKMRIEKLLPKEKQSKETREAMAEFNDKRFQKLAGLLKEQSEDEEWTRSQQDDYGQEDLYKEAKMLLVQLDDVMDGLLMQEPERKRSKLKGIRQTIRKLARQLETAKALTAFHMDL